MASSDFTIGSVDDSLSLNFDDVVVSNDSIEEIAGIGMYEEKTSNPTRSPNAESMLQYNKGSTSRKNSSLPK